jgi:peroxiredoxin
MTAFRTHTDRFAEANAQVLGISVDSFAAAGEFEDKLGLEFPLLSDFPGNEAGKACSYLQRGGRHQDRTTVVIDRDHIVRSIYVEA